MFSSVFGSWLISTLLPKGWWDEEGGHRPLFLYGQDSLQSLYPSFGWQSVPLLALIKLEAHSSSPDRSFFPVNSNVFSNIPSLNFFSQKGNLNGLGMFFFLSPFERLDLLAIWLMMDGSKRMGKSVVFPDFVIVVWCLIWILKLNVSFSPQGLG